MAETGQQCLPELAARPRELVGATAGAQLHHRTPQRSHSSSQPKMPETTGIPPPASPTGADGPLLCCRGHHCPWDSSCSQKGPVLFRQAKHCSAPHPPFSSFLPLVQRQDFHTPSEPAKISTRCIIQLPATLAETDLAGKLLLNLSEAKMPSRWAWEVRAWEFQHFFFSYTKFCRKYQHCPTAEPASAFAAQSSDTGAWVIFIN